MSILELPLETTSIDELIPIGQTLTWYNKTLPSDKYVFNIGQEFDVLVYEKLAKVYPDGVLPDPRYDFIRYVDPSVEAANVHVSQSVQPLTFVGVPMEPHSHSYTKYRILKPENGFVGNYNSDFGKYIADVTAAVSAGTPSGTIGGTGKETAPRHLTAYSIMRVK